MISNFNERESERASCFITVRGAFSVVETSKETNATSRHRQQTPDTTVRRLVAKA